MSGSTYWEWHCAHCGAKLLHIYSIGDGSLLQDKCRNCNVLNIVEKTDEGVLRVFSSLSFKSTTTIEVPVSA